MILDAVFHPYSLVLVFREKSMWKLFGIDVRDTPKNKQTNLTAWETVGRRKQKDYS